MLSTLQYIKRGCYVTIRREEEIWLDFEMPNISLGCLNSFKSFCYIIGLFGLVASLTAWTRFDINLMDKYQTPFWAYSSRNSDEIIPEFTKVLWLRIVCLKGIVTSLSLIIGVNKRFKCGCSLWIIFYGFASCIDLNEYLFLVFSAGNRIWTWIFRFLFISKFTITH